MPFEDVGCFDANEVNDTTWEFIQFMRGVLFNVIVGLSFGGAFTRKLITTSEWKL